MSNTHRDLKPDKQKLIPHNDQNREAAKSETGDEV